MSRTVGIIAEYDPFHKGHEYQLKAAMELSGADTAVCVMSGSFTQRGEPAMLGKYRRAEAALRSGHDLVAEIPFAYGTTGAENFAKGGVRILDLLGVDAISFGSECGDKGRLCELADILCHEDEAFKELLADLLKTGLSFAMARREAVSRVHGEDMAGLLENPNDILAIEYLKEIGRRGLTPEIEVFPVKRKGAGREAAHGDFAGAGHIRKCTESGDLDATLRYLPKASKEAVIASGERLLFSRMLYSAFLHMLTVLDPSELREVFGMDEGLENRLLRAARGAEALSYESYLGAINSKRYSTSRMKRLLLHTALYTKRVDIEKALEEPLFTNILAINEKGRSLLKRLKREEREECIAVNAADRRAAAERAPYLSAISLKADRFEHLLRQGSHSGFVLTPPPLRLPLE